jgi:hypothetical protein
MYHTGVGLQAWRCNIAASPTAIEHMAWHELHTSFLGASMWTLDTISQMRGGIWCLLQGHCAAGVQPGHGRHNQCHPCSSSSWRAIGEAAGLQCQHGANMVCMHTQQLHTLAWAAALCCVQSTQQPTDVDSQNAAPHGMTWHDCTLFPRRHDMCWQLASAAWCLRHAVPAATSLLQRRGRSCCAAWCSAAGEHKGVRGTRTPSR